MSRIPPQRQNRSLMHRATGWDSVPVRLDLTDIGLSFVKSVLNTLDLHLLAVLTLKKAIDLAADLGDGRVLISVFRAEGSFHR
ncbi:hypothetical protein GGD57_002961 [Rhizobium esperanzae]|uniref:Uncharacterized protein n=2 Tax=Rhizobium esperanzae TaxID=1967781 RepID=A0A7W6W5D8_9HYPH|nr:hypothetical protein [Rhizobium esperanzae]